MGESTDALLVYGYDLGNEDEWKVPELELVDYYDDDGGDEEDLAERVAATLLVAAGFTEPDPHPDVPYNPGNPEYDAHFAWYGRKRDAEDALPVKVETHCSAEYPMYLLAAHVIRVSRGCPLFLDFDVLDRQRIDEEWDAKLAAAVAALGWTVDGPPRWILCSDWN